MKISVIITTYNNADMLPRAVQSVLNQTIQDFEILVVDDASTDNTSQVMFGLMEKDPRISYKRLKVNSGGAARPKNTALQSATGDFIATLDADDEWLPTKLEQQLALFKSNPDLGFVGCHEWIVDESGQERKYQIPRVPDVLDRILESDYMGGGSCTMYRKDVFDEVGGFDEALNSGQDWEMRIRLSEHYAFDFIDGEPLIKRYLHKGNISKMKMERKMQDVRHIEDKYRALYSARPKVYSNKLRYDGTRFLLAGHRIDAWKSFLKSIRHNPTNGKTYLYFMASLFGKRIYAKLAETKRALKNDLS